MPNPWVEVDGLSGDWRHPLDKAEPLPARLPPQPWLGRYEAGRVCWLLNGFGTSDGMAFDDPACRETVVSWTLRNLRGDPPDEPNLWLDPTFSSTPLETTRDVKWWLRNTKTLRAAVNADAHKAREVLANRLFVLESYPYARPTRPAWTVPTLRYTFELLTEWIRSGRPVVVGRGLELWQRHVPHLGPAIRSGQAITVRNVQSATISPGNLPAPDLFEDLVTQLVR